MIFIANLKLIFSLLFLRNSKKWAFSYFLEVNMKTIVRLFLFLSFLVVSTSSVLGMDADLLARLMFQSSSIKTNEPVDPVKPNNEIIALAEQVLQLIEQLTEPTPFDQFLVREQKLAQHLENFQKACRTSIDSWHHKTHRNTHLTEEFIKQWMQGLVESRHATYKLINGTMCGEFMSKTNALFPAYGSEKITESYVTQAIAALQEHSKKTVSGEIKTLQFSEQSIVRNKYLKEFNTVLRRIAQKHAQNAKNVFECLLNLVQHDSSLYKKLEHARNASTSFFAGDIHSLNADNRIEVVDEKDAPMLYAKLKEFLDKLNIKKQILIVLNPKNDPCNAACQAQTSKDSGDLLALYIVLGANPDEKIVGLSPEEFDDCLLTTEEFEAMVAHETGHAWLKQAKQEDLLDVWDNECVPDYIATQLTSPQTVKNFLNKNLLRDQKFLSQSKYHQNQDLLFSCLGSIKQHKLVENIWGKELQEIELILGCFTASDLQRQQILALYVYQKEQEAGKKYTDEHPPHVMRLEKVENRHKVWATNPVVDLFHTSLALLRI